MEKKPGIDHGTPEMHRRHLIVYEETSEVRRRARVITTVPIELYYKRSRIDARQYDAANELYRLWYYGAEKSRYVTSRDPREPRGGGAGDGQMELERRYNSARRAIRGLKAALVVYNVVCIGEWLQDIKHVGVPERSRMDYLREGLDDLANHFKMPFIDPPARKKEKASA